MRTRVVITALAASALSLAQNGGAEVRVQDIARLQGQRTNKLMGFGLVVGLDGRGDGSKYAPTMRALMALHSRFQQPILTVEELKGNGNIALVTVEASIPEFGARQGQTVDVVVSAIGPATSLRGGQLLTTPLQESTLSLPDIFALAGGTVEVPEALVPTRGVIRGGATLEQDFFYSFIEDGAITLVLDDRQAGFPLAQMVARAINHEEANLTGAPGGERPGAVVVAGAEELAVALDPKNVRVRIPTHEQNNPAGFISRVLQTRLFVMPEQPARVVINRTTREISFTGTVTVSPTILNIPGLGTVSVGAASGGADRTAGGAPGVVGLDTDASGGVEFQQLLATFGKINLTPQQMVDAVEHLHRTGTLRAQLIYTE